MKEKLENLLKIKSLVTLAMISALIFGWLNNKVTSEQFIPLVTMILTFYFAKEHTS